MLRAGRCRLPTTFQLGGPGCAVSRSFRPGWRRSPYQDARSAGRRFGAPFCVRRSADRSPARMTWSRGRRCRRVAVGRLDHVSGDPQVGASFLGSAPRWWRSPRRCHPARILTVRVESTLLPEPAVDDDGGRCPRAWRGAEPAVGAGQHQGILQRAVGVRVHLEVPAFAPSRRRRAGLGHVVLLHPQATARTRPWRRRPAPPRVHAIPGTGCKPCSRRDPRCRDPQRSRPGTVVGPNL